MIHSWPLLQGISDAVCPVRCSCLLSQPTPFCFFSCEMCGKVKRNLAESAPGGATPLSLPFSVLSVPKPQDFYFLLLGCDHRRKISHICSCANQRMIYSLDYKATNKLLHSPNSYLIFRARWDPSNQRKTGRCGSCLLCLV